MEYKCEFKDDCLDIMEFVNSEINFLNLSKNYLDTKTLSSLYLKSINQIIMGSYESLESGTLHVHRISARSLIDYLAEIWYISILDDLEKNKDFMNYHILYIHFNRDVFHYMRDELPYFKSKYEEYVLERYKDIVLDCTLKSNGIEQIDWQKLYMKVKNKHKGTWTGFKINEKLCVVLVMYYFGNKNKDPISLWNKSKKSVSSTTPNWFELSFAEQNKLIVLELSKENEQVENLDSDPFFESYYSSFKYYSLFAHPSFHSIVPHFSPKTENFELEYNFTRDTFEDAELFLYLSLTSAVYGFSKSLDLETQKEFRTNFNRKCSSSKINEFLKQNRKH